MSKKRSTKYEIEYAEIEERRQFAWGKYGATVRQRNLDDECEKLNSSLSHLSDREKKKKIKEFQLSKNNNMLYIG